MGCIICCSVGYLGDLGNGLCDKDSELVIFDHRQIGISVIL